MKTFVVALLSAILFAAGLVSPVLTLADSGGKGGRGEGHKANAVRIERQLADEVNRSIAATSSRTNIRQAPAVAVPETDLGNAETTDIEKMKEILDLL